MRSRVTQARHRREGRNIHFHLRENNEQLTGNGGKAIWLFIIVVMMAGIVAAFREFM